MDFASRLADVFKISREQAAQTISLLDEGATVPFIARYRKEQTGGLDDQVLRQLADQLSALRALAERRDTILRLLREQDQLTPALQRALEAAGSLTELDDLYRPYRPKRKTRASVALSQGLLPLAEQIAAQEQPESALRQLAAKLAARAGLADEQAALQGALDILAEQVSDDAQVRHRLRQVLHRSAQVAVSLQPDADPVYASLADVAGPFARLASHRILALNRAEKEGAVKVRLTVDQDAVVQQLQRQFVKAGRPAAGWLNEMLQDSWKRLLQPSLTNELRQVVTESAETESIEIFARNLRALLLQAPVPAQPILALDPGFRTGCKVAVVDATGKVLATTVCYPTPPLERTTEAAQILDRLVQRFQVRLIAIGNGTASRETERFVAQWATKHDGLRWIVVSEAGASVYSASELAAAELPQLDVTHRSAVSIARRVLDPLAELVKIAPQSIGVGQYQHDMDQKKLTHALDGVVEACVNFVGADLNTASPALLKHIAGLTAATAEGIVRYREEHGRFESRQELLKVSRLGPRTFEQCAGFLRITGGDEPLDNTSVHPERYGIVRRLSKRLKQKPSPELAQAAAGLNQQALAAELGIGSYTLTDILKALQQPGRDPREAFAQPELRQNILELKDVRPGMALRGVVRNVAGFGAFVDLGLHQDGLIHISELADRFVQDPLDVVSVGQVVRVRVLSVDLERQRLALSLRQVPREDKPNPND